MSVSRAPLAFKTVPDSRALIGRSLANKLQPNL
jgi:hypothetical protein